MPYDRTAFTTRTAQEDIAFDFMAEADMYIADKLFYPKSVKKSLTKIYQHDTSKLRLIESRAKTNSEATLLDEQVFATNVTLEEHKLGREVNPRDVRDADIPQLVDEARAVKHVTNALLVNRESLAATLATTSGNYPTANTSAISSGSRWNEAGGDPEADKATADSALYNAVGRGANALAIDVVTLDKIRTSPQFRTRTQYTQFGPLTEDMIKAYFRVDYLFVCKARYDSAAEGATAAVGGFFSDNAIFFVYNPSAGLQDISYGHMYLMNTPFWTSAEPVPLRRGPAGPMVRVEVGTEYKLGPGYVESSSSSKFAAGYLFRTCVA